MDTNRRASESQPSHPPPLPDLFRSKGTPCALAELVERDLRDINITYPSVSTRTGCAAVAEASTATAPRPRRVGSTNVSWPTNSAGLKLLAGSDSSPPSGTTAPATGSSVSLDGVVGALTLRFTPDDKTQQSSRTTRKQSQRGLAAQVASTEQTSAFTVTHFFLFHGLGYPFARGCAVYSLQ
jgi:hypothetical protein